MQFTVQYLPSIRSQISYLALQKEKNTNFWLSNISKMGEKQKCIQVLFRKCFSYEYFAIKIDLPLILLKSEEVSSTCDL